MAQDPVCYAEAIDLTEHYAEHLDSSAKSAMQVLIAGLRWKLQYDGDEEDPAFIADAFALVFPMHKVAFRKLAKLIRATAMNTQQHR